MPRLCQVCAHEAKYTCASCGLLSYVAAAYAVSALTSRSCSLPCYKQHQGRRSSIVFSVRLSYHQVQTETGCHASAPPCASTNEPPAPPAPPSCEETVLEARPLRPLTSLKWPYAPEESAYPDPLKRDDPKLLQLNQYEAIGTRPCFCS